MKQEQLIDDLIAQLDRSFAAGVGHVNVSVERIGRSAGKD